MKIITHQKAFTLIEVLLYITISTIILSTISYFVLTMMQTQTKNTVASEVEDQGVYILSTITQDLRNARSISSPSAGSTSNTLIFETYDNSTNPTTVSVSGGNVSVQEGSMPASLFNSNTVTVTNLMFSNISRPDTPGSVRIELTLEYTSTSTLQTYSYEKSFYATASLR